jgi:hypothetical protein
MSMVTRYKFLFEVSPFLLQKWSLKMPKPAKVHLLCTFIIDITYNSVTWVLFHWRYGKIKYNIYPWWAIEYSPRIYQTCVEVVACNLLFCSITYHCKWVQTCHLFLRFPKLTMAPVKPTSACNWNSITWHCLCSYKHTSLLRYEINYGVVLVLLYRPCHCHHLNSLSMMLWKSKV